VIADQACTIRICAHPGGFHHHYYRNLIFRTDKPRLKTRMPLWLAIV
jgi:hypothetical protein